MSVDFWWLAALSIFYIGVQFSLSRETQQDLDEAAMLPFADDPEVAQRVERETGRTISCGPCSGVCQGEGQHLVFQEF